MTHERTGTPKDRPDRHRLPDDRKRLHAHDVRHLVSCGICGGLADDRTAISGKWHPRCCFESFGREFVMNLPASECIKFRLSDVDIPTMRGLLEQMEIRS